MAIFDSYFGITRGYPWFKKNPRSQILQIPAQIFSDAISEVLDLEPEVTWDDIGHGGYGYGKNKTIATSKWWVTLWLWLT